MNSHYKKVGTISYGDDQIVLVKCVGGICMMNIMYHLLQNK